MNLFFFVTGAPQNKLEHLSTTSLTCEGKAHRDKTRVKMPAKMFPHLKLLCWLFSGPTLGFDTKQRNSFLIKFGIFLQQKQYSDNIIHS